MYTIPYSHFWSGKYTILPLAGWERHRTTFAGWLSAGSEWGWLVLLIKHPCPGLVGTSSFNFWWVGGGLVGIGMAVLGRTTSYMYKRVQTSKTRSKQVGGWGRVACTSPVAGHGWLVALLPGSFHRSSVQPDRQSWGTHVRSY